MSCICGLVPSFHVVCRPARLGWSSQGLQMLSYGLSFPLFAPCLFCKNNVSQPFRRIHLQCSVSLGFTHVPSWLSKPPLPPLLFRTPTPLPQISCHGRESVIRVHRSLGCGPNLCIQVIAEFTPQRYPKYLKFMLPLYVRFLSSLVFFESCTCNQQYLTISWPLESLHDLQENLSLDWWSFWKWPPFWFCFGNLHMESPHWFVPNQSLVCLLMVQEWNAFLKVFEDLDLDYTDLGGNISWLFPLEAKQAGHGLCVSFFLNWSCLSLKVSKMIYRPFQAFDIKKTCGFHMFSPCCLDFNFVVRWQCPSNPWFCL